MLSKETLLDKWNKLTYHTGGYVRIDSDHPLEWHIGYEGINQKSLLLVSAFEPSTLPSSKSILVVTGQRADGSWAITFRLIRSEQEEVFIHLCCDLIESSRDQSNNIQGFKFVMERYVQWSKLMEHQGSGLLKESEIKGLLGEVFYLQEIACTGMQLLEVIKGWIGPEGADQDFVYADKWCEVKALVSDSKIVSISSLEQLDAPFPGELIIFFIDKTSPNDAKGFSLRGKVAEVREGLLMDAATVTLFDEKLLRYGYIDIPEYEKQHYKMSGSRRYRLDEKFPRLTKESVPTQLAAARYELSIQAIEKWRIE